MIATENASGVCSPAVLNVATPTSVAARVAVTIDASANPPGGSGGVVVVVVVLNPGGVEVEVDVVGVVVVVVVVGFFVEPPCTVAFAMQRLENASPHVRM